MSVNASIISILIIIIILSISSKISHSLFKKKFFFTSFTEGNALSTLEVTSKNSISILDNNIYMKSKTSDDNGITYFLASEDFNNLKKIIEDLEKNNKEFKYQLNSS